MKLHRAGHNPSFSWNNSWCEIGVLCDKARACRYTGTRNLRLPIRDLSIGGKYGFPNFTYDIRSEH